MSINRPKTRNIQRVAAKTHKTSYRMRRLNRETFWRKFSLLSWEWRGLYNSRYDVTELSNLISVTEPECSISLLQHPAVGGDFWSAQPSIPKLTN